MTTLSPAQLNRTTLDRQLLLQRADVGPVEAVRRICLLQAQEPASIHLSLWARVAGLDLADVDDALRGRRLVKASLARLTLHLVAAEDHGWFQAAMFPALRASRINSRTFRETRVDPDVVDGALADVVRFASVPRTLAEVRAHLSDQIGDDHVAEWTTWALRTYAPWVHAPSEDDPWVTTLGRSQLQTPPRPVPGGATNEGSDRQVDGAAELTLRYLGGFGPASVRDLQQATMLPQRVLRPAVERVRGRLVEHRGPDGGALLDLEDGTVVDGDAPAAPRLLPMWDSTLLAFRDRSRILPEHLRGAVIRQGGDTLATVLVDGRVDGAWRHVGGGVEVRAWSDWDDQTWGAVEAEVIDLLRVLEGRDPEVYGRYRRWWQRLPVGTDRRFSA